MIVAPLNTFSGWQEKYEILKPDTEVITIDRKSREEFIRKIEQRRGDVFLMHWDALRLMPELRRTMFNTIIADEVHRASNREAQQTVSLKKIPRKHVLGLSGTAAGDKPDGLWSVNNLLYPTYYTSYWRFRKHYMVEELQPQGYSKIVGLKNMESLHAEMAPWYVRHLKKQQCCPHHPDGVMPWLPDKSYDYIYVDLSPKQRKIYDQMHKHFVAWVGEHEGSPLVASVVIAQLTRLSQISLATPDFDDEGKVILSEPSAKMDAVKELIDDHGDKVFTVFSASRQGCYLFEQKLKKKGISVAAWTGNTKEADKVAIRNAYRRGDIQVFIGSIAAIGEGVDFLQEQCDTGIFLDRHWSSWKNEQAEDRLHRDGQDSNKVQIIDVMARNTLDFGRHTKIKNKWSWIREILGDLKHAQTRVAEEAD